MDKEKKPNLIQIKFDGERATMELEEYEPSALEWRHRRKNAFSELRKDEFIPRELIDLVEGYEERTLVQTLLQRCEEGLRPVVKIVGQKQKGDVVQEFVDLATKIDEKENEEAITASDALAHFLRISLRELKASEKQREAPVRTMKMSSRSLIGEIALDLLENCQFRDYAPGPELNQLVRELLNLQSEKLGASRQIEARERAISIIAHRPEVGIRELACLVNVHPSTISAWLNDDPDFKEMVKQRTEWINTLKANGTWDEILRLFKKGRELTITREELSKLLSLACPPDFF